MRRIYEIAECYLSEQNSSMAIRDFLASIWALGQGGAGLLNSSFYQRYLGDRETLKYAFVIQMLDLPKLHTPNTMVKPLPEQTDSKSNATLNIDGEEVPTITPKLIKPLMPPLV